MSTDVKMLSKIHQLLNNVPKNNIQNSMAKNDVIFENIFMKYSMSMDQ